MVVIMKKFVVLFLLIIIVFSISSCNYDLYEGKRPFDYGDFVWICQELDGYFEVSLATDEFDSPEGLLEYKGTEYLFKLSFPHGSNRVLVTIKNPDIDHWYGYLLPGFTSDAEFSQNKMILTIDKETDTFFNGEIDTLTFIREVDSNSSARND